VFEEILTYLKDQFFIIAYFITWVVSVATYRKYFDTALKYFPIFIAYTFFTDLLGYFIKYNDNFQFFSDNRYSSLNIIIYNIYQLVAYLFFYWVYYRVIQSVRYRKMIRYGLVVTLTTYAISLFFYNPFYKGLYIAETVGSWVLLMCILLYVLEKRKEESAYPIVRNLLFWISLGNFIFYLFTPYMFLLGSFDDKLWFKYPIQKALFVLIAFMYGSYTLGLILSRRKAFR